MLMSIISSTTVHVITIVMVVSIMCVRFMNALYCENDADLQAC
jgi:hypothetical protein